MNFNKLFCQFGIYWDIENCPINVEDITLVCDGLRRFAKYRCETMYNTQCSEFEFIMAYSDTKKINREMLEGLTKMSVIPIHVNCTKKSDADRMLIYKMNEFIKYHSKSTIILITGDIDFGPLVKQARDAYIDAYLLYGASPSLYLKAYFAEHDKLELKKFIENLKFFRDTDLNNCANHFYAYLNAKNPCFGRNYQQFSQSNNAEHYNAFTQYNNAAQNETPFTTNPYVPNARSGRITGPFNPFEHSFGAAINQNPVSGERNEMHGQSMTGDGCDSQYYYNHV